MRNIMEKMRPQKVEPKLLEHQTSMMMSLYQHSEGINALLFYILVILHSWFKFLEEVIL